LWFVGVSHLRARGSTTKMYPGTTDCDRLSATYSYVAYSMRMTRLIHVLCASSQLQGPHGGGGLVTPPGPFSPHMVTHLFHEYHVDIPWFSVLLRGFGDVT
jgi:hypothetical protein